MQFLSRSSKPVFGFIFLVVFVSQIKSETDQQQNTQQTRSTNQSPEPDGTAPEILGLTAGDVSYAQEKNIPDLKEPFIDTTPEDMGDGIDVGSLEENQKAKKAIVTFAQEVATGKHGEIDSLLIYHDNKLQFESYFRRGRVNYPHFQMSITKSYTALAIGRAIQLGYLSMADLNKPVVSFLKDIDKDLVIPGATTITLAQAMNMHSGIRVDKDQINHLRKETDKLKGQGQIQTYLQHSAPITKGTQTFKYQSSDASMTMQVLETVVPGSAREFIGKELLTKMGITNFAWQDDVSGFPKAAAGSSMRSRDMIKWGMLVANEGQWDGEQLIPKEFLNQAIGKLYTNAQDTSYGYFWWRHNMKVGNKLYDCKSGRGAGGQFIFIISELNLIVVVTAHDKGMVGKMLLKTPARILPGFVE